MWDRALWVSMETSLLPSKGCDWSKTSHRPTLSMFSMCRAAENHFKPHLPVGRKHWIVRAVEIEWVAWPAWPSPASGCGSRGSRTDVMPWPWPWPREGRPSHCGFSWSYHQRAHLVYLMYIGYDERFSDALLKARHTFWGIPLIDCSGEARQNRKWG